MLHDMKNLYALLLGITLFAGALWATPSTQIWNPSTDVQPFGVWHAGLDSYLRASGHPVATNLYDAGLTVGVLPWKKLQAEVGVDYMTTAPHSAANTYPMYFNAKVGTPEDSLFKGSPAFAVGGYNFGTKSGITSQNIAYFLAAKTIPAFGKFPSLGRVSAGYYRGDGKVLVDEEGNAANDGYILTWDRTMSEISDKLWFCVDYASGRSANGCLNVGFSWAFTKNTSVIFAEDFYNNTQTGGKPTFTLQLDINL